MKKKLISAFTLCAVILPMLSGLAFAVEPQAQEPIELTPVMVDSTTMTQAEIDKEIERQIYAQISEETGIPLHRVQDYYTTVTFPTKRQTVDGEVGNQVKGGYRFPTGGGFYYSDDGGPEVQVSFSVSLPIPKLTLPVSVGVSLGVRSDTFGYSVEAPDKVNFYKLWVKKTVDITPVGVYRVPSNGAPVDSTCPLAYTMHSVDVVSVEPYAKRV